MFLVNINIAQATVYLYRIYFMLKIINYININFRLYSKILLKITPKYLL